MQTELYEAASVDGAGILRKVWHITLPQLRGVLLVTMILQIIGTAQAFLEPYLFTSGGPANATQTIATQAYQLSFVQFDFGQGAATANILIVISLVFAVLYLRANRRAVTA